MSTRQGSLLSPSFRARVRASIERPVASVFVRTGLSPNALTLIGFGIAVVAAWFAASEAWLVAGLLVAFGAVFDLFDGALARATNKTSKFGAFVDSTFDRAGEAVVYVGLVVALGRVGTIGGAEVAAAAMGAAFMVSYVRAKSESLGFSPASGMANVGLAPREVRSVILVIGLLLAAIDYRWLIGALSLITILATLTTVQRILFVYRQSKSTNQEVTK
jgi:CDP-diacylglycerol--glycerol-3-phosphate 3-phosphatidyltransferase